MIINFYFIFAIIFFIFIILPSIIILLIKDEKKLKILSSVIFIFYLIILFVGTILELDEVYPNLSFYFDFNHSWFSPNFLWFNFSIDNLIINAGLMFPIGFFTYTHFKNNKFLKTILLAFTLSILIEIYQMILPIYRNTEILDIILNTISGIFSAIYFNFIVILSKKPYFNARIKI